MPMAVTLLPTARSTRVPYLSQEQSRWTQIIILQRRGIGVVVFNAIFQLYHDGQYCWRKHKYQEKTTDLPQVTECFIEYTSPWTGLELTTLVVIGTDCIGTCKSNCHTITITTTPWLCKEMTFLGNMLLILNTFSFYFTKRGMYGILMSKILFDF